MKRRSKLVPSPQSDKEDGSADDPCLDPYFDVDLAATHTLSNDESLQLVSSSSGDGQPTTSRRHRGRGRPDDPTMKRHHHHRSPSSSSSSSSASSALFATTMQTAGTADPESLALVRGQPHDRGKALRGAAKGGVAQRRRYHSSSTMNRYAVTILGKERAARTLMMILLVASLVTVMFLAFYAPSPDPMIDEESRIMMWNIGGRAGADSASWLKAVQRRDGVCVVLPASTASRTSVGAAALGNETISESDDREPDYGGLDIELFEEAGVSRAIYRDPSLDETKKDREPEQEERVDVYYAFDDDERRNPYNSRKSKKGQRCRRTKFHRRRPINCNSMYEMDFWSIVAAGNQQYLGGGSYRDVHLIDIEGNGKFVYKTSGPDAKYRYDDYEFIRMDCVVLELLSSSPSIVNSYAYCGLDQIGEAMLNGDFEALAWPIGGRKSITLNDTYHVDPQNSLTLDDKLRFALEMAEALAELHGFYGGVLVHDDIQLSQYLLTNDGKHVRLNDFNRAEFMLWNEENQEYCKYRNNPGHGDWRAPEEYFDDPLDEKIDIFSLGNNLYATLTGLSPFYTSKTKEAVERVKRGEKPYIDPRWRNHSFAEGKIVELIERCYPFKAEDRIDIFQAVRFLRDAVQENERRKRKKRPP